MAENSRPRELSVQRNRPNWRQSVRQVAARYGCTLTYTDSCTERAASERADYDRKVSRPSSGSLKELVQLEKPVLKSSFTSFSQAETLVQTQWRTEGAWQESSAANLRQCCHQSNKGNPIRFVLESPPVHFLGTIYLPTLL
jgi:hypothetical protein